MRQLGSTLIKLLGVYYAAWWVDGVATLAGNFLMPWPSAPFAEGGPTPRDFFVTSVLSAMALGLVAAVCLFRAEAVAGRLFGEDRVSVGALSRRDLIFVGISLIGAMIALDLAPRLLEVAVKVVWYAEASRRPHMWEAINPLGRPLLPTLLTFVFGLAVVAYAARVTRILDSRATGELE